MNFRIVIKQLGLLLCVLSVCMVLSNLAALVLRGSEEKARSVWELMAAAGVGLLLGGTAWLLGRKAHAHIGRREAFLLVAMSWIIGAAVAALPFLFWAHFSPHRPADHPFLEFTNCYFEAMSGLTTTGATILGQTLDGAPLPIEVVPDSLLDAGPLLATNGRHGMRCAIGILAGVVLAIAIVGCGGGQDDL